MSLPLLLELAVNLVYPALPHFWVIKWGLALFLTYKAMEAVVKNGNGNPAEPPLPPGESL